jgi:hypothetical protein
MKTFAPEEIDRLNLLYDLLDMNYRGMREAARIQRAAILHGCLPATAVADINLMALARSTNAAWERIRSILVPATEPVPDPPPDPNPPPKETLQ